MSRRDIFFSRVSSQLKLDDKLPHCGIVLLITPAYVCKKKIIMKHFYYFIIISLCLLGCTKSLDHPGLNDRLEMRVNVYDTLITQDGIWRYLVSNAEPAGKWKLLNYNDSLWKEGFQEFGYGDSDEITVVARNNLLVSRTTNITTYFRKRVFIPSELTIGASEVTFYLHRDDGALVYVNGSEKIRSNMPKGTIKSNTLAISPMEGYVGPLSEKTLYKMSWSASGFQAGWNEIAVEIHQCSTQERDMSFSLRVAATQTININQ